MITHCALCRCVLLPAGEVLLVMNWSLMAYTMCLKILKKHHK